MANIINALTTTNIDSELKKDIATKIALITPWTTTPLTAMLFKANFINLAKEFTTGVTTPADLMTSEKTLTQEFSDFEDEVLGKSSAVTGGTAVGSATASDNTLIVSDASVFKKGDIVAVSEVTTGTRREVMYVYSINYTTNTLTLTRDTDLGILVATIAATDLVYKLAGAHGEGSTMATILSTVKTKRTNYVQNFKAAWGLTEQQLQSQTWTESQIIYQQKKAFMTLMEEIETSFYQGVAQFQGIVDSDGNKVSTTGGILEGIRDGGGYVNDAGTSATKSEIDAMIKDSAQYGPSVKGKILICSNEGIDSIGAITDAYTTNVNPGETVNVGTAVKMYKTNFTPEGGMPIVQSPILDRGGVKGIILLDLDTVKVKEFIPFRTEDIVKVSGEQTTKKQVLGEIGLSRLMFKKNGYLRLTGSTEPIA